MQEKAKRVNNIEIWFQIRSLPLYPTELQAHGVSVSSRPAFSCGSDYTLRASSHPTISSAARPPVLTDLEPRDAAACLAADMLRDLGDQNLK
jgi:hypothetical protein